MLGPELKRHGSLTRFLHILQEPQRGTMHIHTTHCLSAHPPPQNVITLAHRFISRVAEPQIVYVSLDRLMHVDPPRRGVRLHLPPGRDHTPRDDRLHDCFSRLETRCQPAGSGRGHDPNGQGCRHRSGPRLAASSFTVLHQPSRALYQTIVRSLLVAAQSRILSSSVASGHRKSIAVATMILSAGSP
jgi:hypothetical protein